MEVHSDISFSVQILYWCFLAQKCFLCLVRSSVSVSANEKWHKFGVLFGYLNKMRFTICDYLVDRCPQPAHWYQWPTSKHSWLWLFWFAFESIPIKISSIVSRLSAVAATFFFVVSFAKFGSPLENNKKIKMKNWSFSCTYKNHTEMYSKLFTIPFESYFRFPLACSKFQRPITMQN